MSQMLLPYERLNIFNDRLTRVVDIVALLSVAHIDRLFETVERFLQLIQLGFIPTPRAWRPAPSTSATSASLARPDVLCEPSQNR
jgi:hypothetical protein